MKITNEITPIEVGGSESTSLLLSVESNGQFNDRVHLRFGDLDLLVFASDLERAIDNATNHG
jgi:hypothetical protein